MSAKAFLMAEFAKLLDGPLSLQKAIAVAVVAHGNQEDKGQNAYIRHPLRVMERLSTEDEMVCGVLHDALEDTDLTPEHLVELGFTASQIKIIKSLTKTEGYDHEAYLLGIERSPVATKIKLLDMEDNLDLRRLKNPNLTDKDVERFRKYIADSKRLGGLK